MKKLITLFAVAGLVLALAPGATAQEVLYTENFVGDTHEESISSSPVGWSGSGVIKVYTTDATTGQGDDSTPPPDGDTWYAAKFVTGASGSLLMSTTEFTVLAADRVDTEFSVDHAQNTTQGFRWRAQVGGTWYETDLWGTDDATNGSATEHDVTTWGTRETLQVETATWYVEGTGQATPISLPAGDITGFGFFLNNNNNSRAFAVDNFVITGGGVATTPATMIYWK